MRKLVWVILLLALLVGVVAAMTLANLPGTIKILNPSISITGGPLSFSNTLASQESLPIPLTITNTGNVPLQISWSCQGCPSGSSIDLRVGGTRWAGGLSSGSVNVDAIFVTGTAAAGDYSFNLIFDGVPV